MITQAEYQTFGGVVAIALTSFANRFILGKSVDKAKKISVADIVAMAGEICAAMTGELISTIFLRGVWLFFCHCRA